MTTVRVKRKLVQIAVVQTDYSHDWLVGLCDDGRRPARRAGRVHISGGSDLVFQRFTHPLDRLAAHRLVEVLALLRDKLGNGTGLFFARRGICIAGTGVVHQQ